MSMKKFIDFFLSNIIIITVVSASVLALSFPSLGIYLEPFELIIPLIVIVFFCQGTGIKKNEMPARSNYLKVLLIAFFISQVLAPVLAYGCSRLLNWEGDSLVGFMLICCMAPTLVSGTIIAGQAGGDRTVSLLVTIGINIVAVFSIPFNLSWSLGAEVHVAVLPLLKKLLIMVLIPAIIGYLYSRKRQEFIAKKKAWFKYIPISCLFVVIYISMSQQQEAFKELTGRMILDYSLASITVHLILLYIAYYLCMTCKTGVEAARSVAICSSQKTIPITVAIWTSTFPQYALALLPGMIFHLCQIYCDGLIAKKWSRK
jgi:predicted Na+-dependent transporter